MIPPVSPDGRDLNHGCPKGKESGDPTVPARGIVTGRQGRHETILSRNGRWAWLLLVGRAIPW